MASARSSLVNIEDFSQHLLVCTLNHLLLRLLSKLERLQHMRVTGPFQLQEPYRLETSHMDFRSLVMIDMLLAKHSSWLETAFLHSDWNPCRCMVQESSNLYGSILHRLRFVLHPLYHWLVFQSLPGLVFCLHSHQMEKGISPGPYLQNQNRTSLWYFEHFLWSFWSQ